MNRIRNHHAFLLAALCIALLSPAIIALEPSDSGPSEAVAQGDCDKPIAKATDQAYAAQVFDSPLSIALASNSHRDAKANGRCFVQITCGNGSTRSCWGSSCSGTDQSCPAGTGGSCWGSSSGSRSCGSCPVACTKTVSANCANAGGGTVSCTGECGDAYAFDNCYAYCDGNYNYCPNPTGPCPF